MAVNNEIYLRTESIQPEEIKRISVINNADKTIISALISSEPCLLEGARGSGKSFLMRLAEMEIKDSGRQMVSVFVSFNVSSLINTNDPLQFYHWMLAKTLKVLINKLRKDGFSISSYSSSLLSKDHSDDAEKVHDILKEMVSVFEKSYSGKIFSEDEMGNLPDIEDVRDAIEDICECNKIERIYFFFDEAAHVFRPDQQRQFFSLFKDLRSPYISCKAAIYPGVTYFGESFEPIHDCIYKRIERSIKDADYLEYFKEIVYKQISHEKRDEIDKRIDLFNTLIFSCGGNPRILLKTIQDLDKINSTVVDRLVKSFYRGQIWSEHTELGEKYKGHKQIIDWGRDFLESGAIPAIERHNKSRKAREVSESSIYFWIHKDAPEEVKESLRLLTYTGVIRKIESNVRASKSELGAKYEVKYGCIIALEINPSNDSKDFYSSLSTRNCPEFGKNHPLYESIKNFSIQKIGDAQYSESLQNMLGKSINVLDGLTTWQKEKLKSVGIRTIGELHSKTETDLIQRIYGVGPAKARAMKNAVMAELLEYLSG